MSYQVQYIFLYSANATTVYGTPEIFAQYILLYQYNAKAQGSASISDPVDGRRTEEPLQCQISIKLSTILIDESKREQADQATNTTAIATWYRS